MKNFLLIQVLFSCLLVVPEGCATEQAISISQLEQGQKVSKIILHSGQEIDFENDPLGYALFREHRIERFTVKGGIEYFELNNIKSVYYNEGTPDSGDPIYWVMSALLGLLIVMLLLGFSLGRTY